MHCCAARGTVPDPDASSAHPLGNFSISHYTDIQIAQDSIELRLCPHMAEIRPSKNFKTRAWPQRWNTERARVPGAEDRSMKAGLFWRSMAGTFPSRLCQARHSFLPVPVVCQRSAWGSCTARPSTPPRQTPWYSLHHRDGNFPGRAGWQEIIARTSSGITLIRSSVPDTIAAGH